MTKKSILCCAFICILLPVFTQEFTTPHIQIPQASGTTASAENAGSAVLAEQDSPTLLNAENTTAVVIEDEKKFGITPVLMLSAWGIEPGISVQIFQGEAEVSVPVTISLQNKAGVAWCRFIIHPLSAELYGCNASWFCHQQHHRLNDRCGQQNINTQRVLPFRLPVGSGFRCFCKILPTLGRLVWRHHTHQF